MPTVMQCVGTPNARHNLDLKYRANLENVDQDLSKYNEVIEHKTVEEIYAERLQEAFVKFNEKQKRKDRRLDVKYSCSTYLEYQRTLDKLAQESDNAILKQGRPPIRELILQIGNPEQGYGCANQTDEQRQEIKQQLLEVYEEFKESYSQFAWGDVVLHCDEVSYDAEGKEHGSIHLHVSFVPLCYQNKQGPEVQVAFERCLNEMGFSSFEAWKHDMDSIMEKVLDRHDLERTFADNHEKHGKSTEWHKQQRMIKENRDLEYEINANKSIAYSAQELADHHLQEADKALDKMLESQSKLEKIEKRLNINTQAVDRLESLKERLDEQVFWLQKEVASLEPKKDQLVNEIKDLQLKKQILSDGVKELEEQKLLLEDALDEMSDSLEVWTIERNAAMSACIQVEDRLQERFVGVDIEPLLEKHRSQQRQNNVFVQFWDFCFKNFNHIIEQFNQFIFDKEAKKQKRKEEINSLDPEKRILKPRVSSKKQKQR